MREQLDEGPGSFALCCMRARTEGRARRRGTRRHGGMGCARESAADVAAPTERWLFLARAAVIHLWLLLSLRLLIIHAGSTYANERRSSGHLPRDY